MLCDLCHLSFKELTIGSVPTQGMGFIADLNLSIEVLIESDPALNEANPEGRGLYLKEHIAELDGVIGSNNPFMVDGIDSIEVGASQGSEGISELPMD